jgi:protein-disulfide isomerase/uncharacterized membrane protein
MADLHLLELSGSRFKGGAYRLYLVALLVIGMALSILSATDLCNFGGCSETHLYRLFGLSFPVMGVIFFTLAGLLALLENRITNTGLVFDLLLAGVGGAEIPMILLQKNVIKAWCPVCLGIAAVIYLLSLSRIIRFIICRKEKIHMTFRSTIQPTLLFVAVLLGFCVAFTGIAKTDASAGQLNIALGKQDSKLEVYLFSDWLCPVCVKVEGVIESVYPALSRKTRILFVDKVIHPEAANFVPYHLSFAANEKTKYLQLRKALFSLAQKTKNPSYDDIKAATAPLQVDYRQLSFMDVTQQMSEFQKLGEQFNVTSTPTLVIRNAKSKKTHVLVGGNEITPDQIMKALKDVE